MTDDPAGREGRTLDAWFDAARRRQGQYVAPAAPRMIALSAEAMAGHMGFAPSQAEANLSSMAFWQMFLPSVLGADPANFTDVRSRMPHSYGIVRRGVADVRAHRQLVFAAFHMAVFPLVAAMMAAAVVDEHGEPGHVLVARRNLGWLRLDSGRWVSEVAHVIATDPRGLHQLVAGMREGSIRRLLILVDGPHPPGGPGTHALGGIGPSLGFKTGLLRRLLEMNIPVVPLVHAWESSRLVLEWQPRLAADPGEGIPAIARLIEALLHRHPEQWLNWAAAGRPADPTVGA